MQRVRVLTQYRAARIPESGLMGFEVNQSERTAVLGSARYSHVLHDHWPGQKRVAVSLDGVAKGARHSDRVKCTGHRGVQQYAIEPHSMT
jgi:hypothetical protein